MINLLIGPPGGGKSYEAVVYHILPALAKGRLVITNLPLDLERLASIDASYPDLIKLVEGRRGVLPVDRRARLFGRQAEPEEGMIRAFASMADYSDSWRHPVTGAGPLYVIDECHLPMPRGSTAIEVEEWFSLHRHELADVLLITQSYGKVSKSIVDLVQVCYRVKKGTAFGVSSQYIRKVQDGVRGDVVNTSVRKYEKRFFGLYKSHTRSGAGQELEAEDIVPLWRRWPFIGAAICIVGAVGIFFAAGSPNILKPKGAAKQAFDVPKTVYVRGKVQNEPAKLVLEEKPEPKPELKPVEVDHPFSGRTFHIVGQVQQRGKTVYEFAVAQNGQRVSNVSGSDLETLGYTVRPGVPCAAHVSFEGWHRWIICDAPQVAVVQAMAPASQGVAQSAPGG
jgi:zona occludens toxin